MSAPHESERPERGHHAPRAGTPRVQLVALDVTRAAEAARLLTDAFVDDPALLAIGPSLRLARRVVLHRYHTLTLREVLRGGGSQWCAASGGRLTGVAITLPEHSGSGVPLRALLDGLLFLPTGPAPALRRARAMAVTERGYPRQPHLLLLFLATRADVRGQGIGGALLERVLEDAAVQGLPVVLDTTRFSNVAYYRRFGFEQIGEAPLTRSARVWFMRCEH